MDETKLQTCSEIYCLLKHFPKTYIDKLPQELLNLIKQNSDSKYFIEVDVTKPLEQQDISNETKNTIVVFKYNYWSNEYEKRNIIKRLEDNEKNYQDKLREKYNPDNLFSKKIDNIMETKNNEMQLIEYRESALKKILNKIRAFFKNKNGLQ